MTAAVSAPTSDTEQPLLDLDGLVAGVRWRRRMWTAFALVGLVLGVAAAVALPSRASAAPPSTSSTRTRAAATASR